MCCSRYIGCAIRLFWYPLSTAVQGIPNIQLINKRIYVTEYIYVCAHGIYNIPRSMCINKSVDLQSKFNEYEYEYEYFSYVAGSQLLTVLMRHVNH